jgi:hypothetical protein
MRVGMDVIGRVALYQFGWVSVGLVWLAWIRCTGVRRMYVSREGFNDTVWLPRG